MTDPTPNQPDNWGTPSDLGGIDSSRGDYNFDKNDIELSDAFLEMTAAAQLTVAQAEQVWAWHKQKIQQLVLEADRRTLETTSAILSSGDSPARSIDITQTYITNKLVAIQHQVVSGEVTKVATPALSALLLEARLEENYKAMTTCEQYGGASPEQTATILKMEQRRNELKSQLAQLEGGDNE